MMPVGPQGSAFSLPVVRAADTVSPVAQASTNAWAPVVGSELDATHFQSVAYTLANVAQTIQWRVVGANATDFSDAIIVQAAADVVAAAFANYSTAAAVWRHYRVEILDKLGGTHGTVTVRGVAK